MVCTGTLRSRVQIIEKQLLDVDLQLRELRGASWKGLSQPEPELEPESAQGDREQGEDTKQLRWWERPDVLARMRCDPSTGDETSQVMLSKYQISSRFAIAMTCVVTGACTINLTYSTMHD